MTGLNDVFVVTSSQVDQITSDRSSEKDIALPYLRGRNVKRYAFELADEYLLFTDGISDKSHPNIMSYLKEHKSQLEVRSDIINTSKQWYELRPCNYYGLLRQPKIIYASIGQHGSFVLDETGTFIDKTCYFIPTNDKYLLGLLNSSLLKYFFASIAVQRRGGYFEYLAQYVSQMPIRPIDFSNAADKLRHDSMVVLVESMLALQKHKAAAQTQPEQELLQRQIEITDRQIDALVYELYELTPVEIAIVEGIG